MSALTTLTSQPRRLTIGGVAYDIHPLTLADLGQLEAWIQRQFPDPFQAAGAAIAAGDWTVPQQQFLLSQAMDRTCRPKHLLGTPEADRLMQSIEGVKQLLIISIRKGRPEFSESDATALWSQLGIGDLEAVFSATGVDHVLSDPKDGSTTLAETGNSASPLPPKPVRTGGSSTTRR